MPGRKVDLSRRKFLKTGATAATGISFFGLTRFFRKRSIEKRAVLIDSAERFLKEKNFSSSNRREWAHLLNAFSKRGLRYEEGLAQLRVVELAGAGTKGLTPIDVVRTIRDNEPSRHQAARIRTSIRPEHSREEVLRRENIARICDNMEKLGKPAERLNALINKMPKNELDYILRARKTGNL